MTQTSPRLRAAAFPTLRRAAAWWLGTLAGIAADLAPSVASRLVPHLGRGGARLEAHAEGDALVLVRRAGTAARTVARLAADREPPRLPTVDPVDLVLPAGAALRKRLTLPAAVEANLAEVVGLEIDRETPFRRDEVIAGHRIAGREGATLTVEIALVPRSAVARMQDRLARAGLTAGDIRVAGWPLPLAAAAAPARRGLRVTRGLAAALALAALAAVAGPAVLHRIEAAELETQLAALRGQAAAAERLRAEWERRQGGGLDGLRQAGPGALDLLDGLTRLLPDGVWLTEMRLAGGEVTLAGYAPDAAGLIAALERSGLLEGARFLAPVTSDPIRRRERFQIAAAVKAGGGS